LHEVFQRKQRPLPGPEEKKKAPDRPCDPQTQKEKKKALLKGGATSKKRKSFATRKAGTGTPTIADGPTTENLGLGLAEGRGMEGGGVGKKGATKTRNR